MARTRHLMFFDNHGYVSKPGSRIWRATVMRRNHALEFRGPVTDPNRPFDDLRTQGYITEPGIRWSENHGYGSEPGIRWSEDRGYRRLRTVMTPSGGLVSPLVVSHNRPPLRRYPPALPSPPPAVRLAPKLRAWSVQQLAFVAFY